MAEPEYAWRTYNQNIKTAYNRAGDANGCFETFTTKGKYEWKDDWSEFNFWWVDEDGKSIEPQPSKYLLLKDNDIPWSNSSAAQMKVAAGWRVTVQMATDNNNYWDDNTEGNIDGYYANTTATNRQDFITVVLTGDDGDYISIDLDEEFSGIANFRIRTNGAMINADSPKNINDEVRIRLVKVEHWEPVQDEVQGPMEQGGEGDLDGDGVKDKDDADPNDPDIQEEGDVDDDPDNPFAPPTTTPPPPPPPPPPPEDETDTIVKALVMALVLGAIGFIVYRLITMKSGGEPLGE